MKRLLSFFSKSRCRFAFTLVELLVVISIIIVMISLLLPSLRMARESAKSLRCKSNLKGLGTAVMMYVNDWNGNWPYSDSYAVADGGVTQWLYAIEPRTPYGWTAGIGWSYYFKSIYHCPCVSGGNTSTDYAMNYYVNPGKYPNKKMPANLDSKRILILDSSPGSMKAWLFPSSASDRHNGGPNILYCDFHVAWKKLENFKISEELRDPGLFR